MLASSYPVLDAFLTILYFFLFIIWIWLLITVFIDIFRSHDMGGLAKALWVIFVIILPVPGCLRVPDRPGRQDARAGGGRRGAAAEGLRPVRAPGRRHPGADTARQLSKLADLKNQGVLTDAEFEAQKAKILASRLAVQAGHAADGDRAERRRHREEPQWR